MTGLPVKLLVAGLLIAGTGGCAAEQLPETASASPGQPAEPAAPPNIVFVLADDLSWDLVRHMPQVRRMQRDGTTLRQFVVSDSRCCPSRATILTGQFPHNTRVLTNMPGSGGYRAFTRHRARERSVAIALRGAGYRTALMGKYLNGYVPALHSVDPGWDEWLASGRGYEGFGYPMSDNGRPVFFGHRRRDYLTDVLSRRGTRFIRRNADRRPFFVELASFAPHSPYRSAPRHRRRFRRLRLPRGPGFDARTAGAPAWLGRRSRLRRALQRSLRRHYQARVRSVQALDELIGRVRATLRREGVADDTYVVFSSDNGYHLGQHRLTYGKQTAFDHDVRVPLIVVGPDVPAGATTTALAGTVDLAPTFEDWAGVPLDPRRDGRSLAALLEGTPEAPWRRALLVEHSLQGRSPGDPDAQEWRMGKPPSYGALRTVHTTYVEYESGERELYDRRSDPGELHNRYGELGATARAALSAALERYRTCSGTEECWSAGLDAPP